MPFELIMLMGFFGAALLGLLPAAAADLTTPRSHRHQPTRRSDEWAIQTDRDQRKAERLTEQRPATGRSRRTDGLTCGHRL
jgi:hypothetical protein